MNKYTAGLIAAAILLVTGCCTTHQATKWEYKTVTSITEVNKLAGEGWIVAGFSAFTDTGNHDYHHFLLKRALR